MITKEILAKELTNSKLPLNQRIAELCINAVLSSIFKSLSKGESIELRGFGTFLVKKTAAHQTGINSRMSIPEHGRIVFRPCESLRKAAWIYGKGKTFK